MKKLRPYLVLCLALLLALGLCPPALAATGVSVQGRTVAELGSDVFAALADASGTGLYKIPADGEMTLVEAQTDIRDLVTVGDSVYYLRYDPPAYQLVACDKDGKLLPLAEFAEGQQVDKLSYYDGMLYLLVDNVLTLMDPAGGEPDELNTDIVMSDYVISNDVIYYISADEDEKVTYDKEEAGHSLSGTYGQLFSMTISGSTPEQVLDKGVSDLKAFDGNIYLHNMEDNYSSVSGSDYWLEGKLYRLNMATNQLVSMNLNYDWAYFPAANGVVVSREKNVSIFPLNGGAEKLLFSPEARAIMTATADNAYVYEISKGVLTQVPLNGAKTRTLYSGGPITDPSAGSATPAEGTAGAEGAKGLADEIPADGYIFPDSATRKLTMDDLRQVDGTLWELGRLEILARHGYEFNTKSVQAYFNGKSWYTAGGYRAGMLDAIETYNNSLIKRQTGGVLGRSATSRDVDSGSSSAKTGGYIFPNSKTKKLTRSQILDVSKSKWAYGRNEILARHGYQFETKKFRDYFNGKTWYKPGGYSRSSVSSLEWDNMNLIKSMEQEYGLLDDDGRATGSTGRTKLSKNVFSASSTKKLKASQLKGLSAEKLATARNEILARHGYPFKESKWINYFKKIGWKRRSNYSSKELNAIEWYNIDLIKKYE